MKCPKCHYLSFEPEPRCRNCGYDLDVAPDDLELRVGESYEGPLADLSLRAEPHEISARPVRAAATGPIDLDQVVGHEPAGRATARSAAAVAEPPALRVVPPTGPVEVVVAPPSERLERPDRPVPRRAGAAPRRPAPSTTAELPLFVKGRTAAPPDEPLVRLPAEPSAPIAVRRAQPPTPRTPVPSVGARRESSLGPFERDLLQDLKRLERRVSDRAREAQVADEPAPAEPNLATLRLAAAAIDALLLGSISAGVLGATLRLLDLGLGQAASLPIVPLGTFLLLVAAGYLIMFTVAGGQTVGKMLMGIRVVSDDGDELSLPPGQAAMRALLTVPSVLMLGLGFLPAMSGHGLAVHDRLAHTRVIET